MVAVGGMPAAEQDGAAAGHGGSLPGRIAAAVGSRVPERKETAGGGSQARVHRKYSGLVSLVSEWREQKRTAEKASAAAACEAGQTPGGHSDAAGITARSRSSTEQTQTDVE